MSIIIFSVLDVVELYVIPTVPSAPDLRVFAAYKSDEPVTPPIPTLKFIPMDCD